MSTVLPISAVTGVALSAACGTWLLGERPPPLAWIGVAAMLPALWLVSGGGRASLAARGAARDGLIASVGVAVQYVGLGMASDASGLWAVASGRVAAVAVLVPVMFAARRGFHAGPGDYAKALAIGGGAAVGLALYLVATREQMLAVAVTVASLYPAIPVVLGILVLRERLTPLHTTGLALAGASVILLSTPGGV